MPADRAGDAGAVEAGEAEGGAGAEATAVLDEAELEAWARRLGEIVTKPSGGPGVFVALHGPLGAGKTTLVRAACRGAGVEGTVRSPTFTLHNHHRPRGRRPVHHVDLYRIDAPEELDDLGWDELVDARGAVFVEWAERAGPRLPRDRWEVRLSMTDDPHRRRVAARAVGEAPPVPAPGGRAAGSRAGDRDRRAGDAPSRGAGDAPSSDAGE